MGIVSGATPVSNGCCPTFVGSEFCTPTLAAALAGADALLFLKLCLSVTSARICRAESHWLYSEFAVSFPDELPPEKTSIARCCRSLHSASSLVSGQMQRSKVELSTVCTMDHVRSGTTLSA
jgi:hypothetical protein